MKDLYDYSLLHHNTFGIEAKCRRFVEYASTEEAQALVRTLTEADESLLLLGEGSNLLLTKDFPGTVITPDNRFEVRIEPCNDNAQDVLLICWAGTTFDDVVAYAIENGCFGMENLSLIPGEVGASAVQNIGAYGVEACDFISEIEAVEIATGEVRTIRSEECSYSYRQSRFKQEWRDKFLITHVTYRLHREFMPRLDYGNIRASLEAMHIDRPTPAQLRQTVIDIRRAKLPDPKELGNAGSFFMNPVVGEDKFLELKKRFADLRYFDVTVSKDGLTAAEMPASERRYKIPAGWMIDRCGWKGKTLGPAGVHDKQALVLVNLGGATGSDIVKLYTAIQKDVKDTFGIDIYPEVNVR